MVTPQLNKAVIIYSLKRYVLDIQLHSGGD